MADESKEMSTPEIQPSSIPQASNSEGGQRNRVLELLEKFLQKIRPGVTPSSERLSQAHSQMNKQSETKSPKMPPTPQTGQSS